MVDSDEASPWDNPAPTYKAVPEVNPKTGEPVQFYGCTECGGVVLSRKIHSRWHLDSLWKR